MSERPRFFQKVARVAIPSAMALITSFAADRVKAPITSPLLLSPASTVELTPGPLLMVNQLYTTSIFGGSSRAREVSIACDFGSGGISTARLSFGDGKSTTLSISSDGALYNHGRYTSRLAKVEHTFPKLRRMYIITGECEDELGNRGPISTSITLKIYPPDYLSVIESTPIPPLIALNPLEIGD